MRILGERLEREDKTVKAMIEIYCRDKHSRTIDSCPECREIYDYASYRILRCPHKENKPSCAKCEIHCFNARMKEQIRKVMIHSGPKMLIYHPVMSFMHYLDSLRPGSLRKSLRT